jgi:hypothetical protein
VFDSWRQKFLAADDEHATNVGAQNPSPVAATLAVDSAEAAKGELQATQARRGRPRKSAANSEGTVGTLSPVLANEIARQLEQCYDPKVWGALLSAPGDLMLVVSGREHWKLSNEERATLGACGSAAARTLMITNPRALAFLMLGSALFSAYVPRAIVELRALQSEKKQKENIHGAAQ